MCFLQEIKDLAARDLYRHAMQVEPRLRLIATLLELAEYAVLDARALEVQHKPGIQREISSPLSVLRSRSLPCTAAWRRAATEESLRPCCPRAHIDPRLALQGGHIGHFVQEYIVFVTGHNYTPPSVRYYSLGAMD